MSFRKQMKVIEEEKEAQSISLENYSQIQENDVIQEYGNLQFSDEMGDMERDDRSSDQGQLSADKLKFLGVDRFPGSYKHKIAENSDTGLGETSSMNHEISRPQVRYPSRKKKQQAALDPSSFNIDSFLNSEPSREWNDNRLKNNTNNAFGKVSKIDRLKPSHEISKGTRHNHRSKYEQRNKEIMDFIKNYKKNDSIKKANSELSSVSSESITLITLPQNPGPIFYRNQAQQQCQHECQKSSKQFDIRLEQARINFLDTFLPETMKIGNNPYNFLKYMNSKTHNFLRIV